MKSSLLLVLLLTSVLSATSLGIGRYYNRLRLYFKNHHYSECVMMGNLLLQEYPDFFKNDWVSLYTAVAMYKMGHEEEGIRLLTGAREIYSKSPIVMNGDLLLYFMADNGWSDSCGMVKYPEILILREIISDMSVSLHSFEKHLGEDTYAFLERESDSPECELFRKIILEGTCLTFTEEELPLVMIMLTDIFENLSDQRESPFCVEPFIALFLVEQSRERLPIPEFQKMTKKMHRLTKDDSRVSPEVAELYKMIY